jgi:Xaa-Pro aminopeptidase
MSLAASGTTLSRFARVRALAAERGLDALWVSAGASFRWLAGGSPYPGGLPVWLSALIVPVEGPGVAVLSTMHADILDRVRAVKDADEIELLRASGRAVDAGYAAARDATCAGGSWAESGAAIYQAMVEAGSSQPHVSGSFRSYRADVLQPGDMLDVDIGAEVGGYSVDTARNLFIGQPSDELAAAHEVLEQAFGAAAALVRPGVAASAVYHACAEVLAEAGHRQSWKVGHGVGLTATHEAPLIQPGNAAPLEEGMVFTIDPGFFLRRDEPLHLEETVVVTEDGCERMTRFPLGVFRV